jgi:hypothetical protein
MPQPSSSEPAGSFRLARPIDWRSLRLPYGIALLVVLCLAAIHTGLIVSLDNTNLGTTNGLWKAPSVHAWETGAGRPFDSGGWMYFPSYGVLCRLIPDSMVSYGAHGSPVTFRKMALLNGFFGALASGAIFLLAFRYLASVTASLVVVLGHACAAFVLLNSLNSEDVVPAYAFFVVMAALVSEAMSQENWLFCAGAAGALALVTLLHWTLMIPALAGLATAEAAILAKSRRVAWVPPTVVLLFLLLIAFYAQVLCHGLPIQVVLYPGKATPNGYIGFGWFKLASLLAGVGNYLSGGYNLSNTQAVFQSPHFLRLMTVSWLYLVVTGGVCLLTLVDRKTQGSAKALAAFALGVFGAGELEHLYSQPQDPQSQIQPMFVCVAGLVLLLVYLRRVFSGKRYGYALTGIAALLLANGAYNLHLFYQTRGYDSQSIESARKLAELFPPSRCVMVSHGFEGWNTWVFVQTFAADSPAWLRRNIFLASAYTQHYGITPEAAAREEQTAIREAFERGDRVFAAALWTEDRQHFIRSLTTVVDYNAAAAFTDRMLAAFRAGQRWQTPIGPVVELFPVTPGNPRQD